MAAAALKSNLIKVYDAPTAYKYLNGIINVYKPAGMKLRYLKNTLIYSMCRDLNEMIVREPRSIEEPIPMLEPGGAQTPLVRKLASLADDILAVGPRYQAQDIRLSAVAGIGDHASGVVLFGINKGARKSILIQRNRPLRAYHLTVCMGTSTETHFPDSLTTATAKYHHVRKDRISALAASMQASHQRKMYELCGLDLQSQAAYDIACKGLVRPASKEQPVVYGIKLTDFQPPHFTLEVHAINENESYLATLAHEMGIELRTVAHCSALRCIRHGQFGVEHSLLRHRWTLENIFENMRQSRQVLKQHPYLLQQDKIELRK